MSRNEEKEKDHPKGDDGNGVIAFRKNDLVDFGAFKVPEIMDQDEFDKLLVQNAEVLSSYILVRRDMILKRKDWKNFNMEVLKGYTTDHHDYKFLKAGTVIPATAVKTEKRERWLKGENPKMARICKMTLLMAPDGIGEVAELIYGSANIAVEKKSFRMIATIAKGQAMLRADIE